MWLGGGGIPLPHCGTRKWLSERIIGTKNLDNNQRLRILSYQDSSTRRARKVAIKTNPKHPDVVTAIKMSEDFTPQTAGTEDLGYEQASRILQLSSHREEKDGTKKKL